MIRYNNAEDASLRLNSSLVRYEGKPYYCKVTSHNTCKLYTLESLMENTFEDANWAYSVNYNDPELCIDAIDIGYVNYATDTRFVTRPPFRKQKQGSSTENLVAFPVGSIEYQPLTGNHFFTNQFIKALNNEYPSLKECVESLKAAKKMTSRAFSRNFCIKKTEEEGLYTLFYDNIEIGQLVNGKVMIHPESSDSILVYKLGKVGVHI